VEKMFLSPLRAKTETPSVRKVVLAKTLSLIVWRYMEEMRR
jgi:hypothetical protein